MDNTPPVNTTPEKPPYLRKSIKFFRIYGSAFVFGLLMSNVLSPLRGSKPWVNDLIDLVVGLPVFLLFIMAPMGLYYSRKSSRLKEAFPRIRFRYFIGHVFSCLLVLLFIIMFIRDIAMLF